MKYDEYFAHVYSVDTRKDSLCHFNPNHDPKTGQFAKSNSGGAFPRYNDKKHKFGKDKYVNDDGTLTAKGQERYAADIRKNKMKKKDQRVKDEDVSTVLKDPNRWVREDIENVRNISEAGEKIVRSASDLEKITRKNKKFDLSNMTDAELRSQINRWQLEDTYSRLATDHASSLSKGRETVKNILDVAGPVLGVTSSALMIALNIQRLKGGG